MARRAHGNSDGSCCSALGTALASGGGGVHRDLGHQMAGTADLGVPAIGTSSHCSSAGSLHHVRVCVWAAVPVPPPEFAAALPPHVQLSVPFLTVQWGGRGALVKWQCTAPTHTLDTGAKGIVARGRPACALCQSSTGGIREPLLRPLTHRVQGRCRRSGGGARPPGSQHQSECNSGGVFAQHGHSAGTAPIITVIIQVTTLKTTHLRNHAQSIQNSNIQTSDACHGSQGPKFCPL